MLRAVNIRDRFWKTKDGTICEIVDMEDSHLVNCINYLEKKHSTPTLKEWPVYKNLLAEAKKRGLDGGTTSSGWDS